MASRVMSLFARREVVQTAEVEAAALRSDRFRQEREGDWQRLEAIVTAMEKGRLRRLSDADVLDLPALYRTTASSLAIARETSLDDKDGFSSATSFICSCAIFIITLRCSGDKLCIWACASRSRSVISARCSGSKRAIFFSTSAIADLPF